LKIILNRSQAGHWILDSDWKGNKGKDAVEKNKNISFELPFQFLKKKKV